MHLHIAIAAISANEVLLRKLQVPHSNLTELLISSKELQKAAVK